MKIRIDRCGRSSAVHAALLFALSACLLSAPAQAQRDRRPAARPWHGDIKRFHEHDLGVWRGGRWAHQRHEGHLGWWWVVGGAWYFYPAPVYPYPDPWEPPSMRLAPPAAPVPLAPVKPYWYFCEESATYYPYVASCPGGWKAVPALTASPSASQTQSQSQSQ